MVEPRRPSESAWQRTIRETPAHPRIHGLPEQRLSNDLLWQAAYAELRVTDVQWPDFREDDLEAALAAYAARVRR